MASVPPPNSFWSRHGPFPRTESGDGAATGALMVVVLVMAVVGSVQESTYSPLHLILVAAMLVPLAWRVRRPRLVAVVVASVAAVIWLVTRADWHTAIAGGIAVYALGRRVDRPESLRWFTGILVALVAVAAGQAYFDEATTSFVVPARAGLVVAAFWFGDAQRSRDQLLMSLRERAERAEEHRRVVARQAVLDERNRISRELHDVIAHSLSVMVVQSTAAVRLAPVDTEGSVAAMEAVADVGRDTMSELRNVLGLLDDEGTVDNLVVDQLAPQPVLADLSPLIERFRKAGVSVGIEVPDADGRLGPGDTERLVAELKGDGRELGATVQLVVVRVVQEALTNVLKHAPGAAAVVRAHRRHDEIELMVRNDRGRPSTDPGPPVASLGGRGLVGMEERIRALGGRFSSGPEGSGGFEIRASIPVLSERAAG